MLMESFISVRKFGIELVGSVPWGTHLCQFYESKQDLIDILVPYFTEGLRGNEFCMWVTSPPLEAEEAKEALRKAVPDLDRYVKKGQIEIVSYMDWYLLGGKFDSDKVLQGWVKKETDAIKHGFEGLRLTGNTFWVERSLWKSFVDYEEAVNAVIGQHKMLALCTYCLKNASGTDVADVVRNHVGTLLKQGKKWVLLENAGERKKEQDAAMEREQSWQTTLGSIGDAVIATDSKGEITFMNNVAEKLTGWTLNEASKKPLKKIFHIVNEQTRKESANPVTRVLQEGQTVGLANHTVLITKDGNEVPIDDSGAPIKHKDGKISGVVLVFRDITERKKAEKDLFNLAKFPSENPFAVLRISGEGTVMYANSESLRLPKPISVQVGQIVRPIWLKYVTEALTSNHRLNFEENAGDRWFEFKVAPILSEGYVNIYGSDITERKKAEQALRESELKFRTVANYLFDWEYWLAPDGSMIFVSNSCEKITGYKAEEFIENPPLVSSIIHPEDKHLFDSHFKLTKNDKTHEIDFRIITRNREVKWLAHTCQPVFDDKGNGLGRRVSNRDITERKKAEEAARKSEAASVAAKYARSLIESSLDPLVTISAEGKITDVNQATEEATGYSREQLVGSDFSDYFTEPEKAKQGYQEVFKTGFVKDYPLAIRHTSGKITDVLYNATLYRNEAGVIQGVFAAARDVTERIAMENELRQALEKLRQSNAELEQFAYVASHDLQEPLRMVASYVQLLERRYKGKLDPEADEFIAYAVDGANRMRGLIDDLLTYSRVGRLGKPFEPTNLETTFDIVLKNLQASIKEYKATVTHDKLPVVNADGTQLVQLFQNLIGNAIKFHGEEPPRVHVSAKDKGSEIQFGISDNGIGIDPQYFDRLFKIFQRLHTREEYPGSGIGLAVCKKIVERHGGRIWIESQLGKGSTIHFTLSKRKQ